MGSPAPTIYLASPIDQGRTSAEKTRAFDYLLSRGCAVFDPGAGWSVPPTGVPNPSLQKGNLSLLRACDGVLAILKPDLLTIGVVMEIEEAIHMGIPVQVYGPELRPSWSLAYLGLKPHGELIAAVHSLWKEAAGVRV
jgi:nucleoside 2-deoxyribosyltransferase